MSTLLIRGGRIIDPSQQIDRTADLLVENGKIVGLVDGSSTADEVFDASGLIVCPGLIDAQVSFREPGHEEDETIASGTAAALAGGMTSVACLPDTFPVVDNRSAAEFIIRQAERARNCNVFPLGAVTQGHAGKELAEIGQLVEGGAVGFSDAKHSVANSEVMRRALEYSTMFGKPIFNHPQVPELVKKGVMHEGFNSTLLGLRGMPAAAEDIMVGRDIALAEMTGGHIHLMAVSTENSVDQVRRAKKHGVHISAAVSPHQLVLTDESLREFDPNYKVDPPLRGPKHIEALIVGLKDGTIDVICSDHQPFSQEKKNCEIDLSPFGIVGLETLLPVCIKALIEPGHLTWAELISKLTCAPAELLGINKGTLKPAADADITLIDPDCRWTIDPSEFLSKSRNTPFAGWEVVGRARAVVVSGEIRYQAGQ